MVDEAQKLSDEQSMRVKLQDELKEKVLKEKLDQEKKRIELEKVRQQALDEEN